MSANGLAERIWFRMRLKPALRVVCAGPERLLRRRDGGTLVNF